MDVRTKRTWAGLVSYANGAATEPGEIRRIIGDCMPWVAAVEPFGLLDPMLVDEQGLLKLALEYRPSVEVLLRWLCSEPKSKERSSSHWQALGFLREHGQHIRGMHLKEVYYDAEGVEQFNYTAAERESLREEQGRIWDAARYKTRDHKLAGTDFSPFGILAPSKEYKDFADPICDFVLSEYQRYLNREYNRRDKKPAPLVPIFVCPNCNKLVMPERVGRKQYCSNCSDRARAEKYRQTASPDENRDYQWLYRLRHLEPTLLRVRLRTSKVRERLKEVKARQRDSSRCQSLLLDMRL
jgi:hypothetical protein